MVPARLPTGRCAAPEPRPGTPRRDWKQTQVSDGHLMVRHPDWDTALKMCEMAAANIKMYAQ